jgi:hypothetical protein
MRRQKATDDVSELSVWNGKLEKPESGKVLGTLFWLPQPI